MSMDLKFEEEQIQPIRGNSDSATYYPDRFNLPSRIPTIVRFCMKTRIVRNERQARVFVVVIVCILFLLTVYLMKQAVTAPTIIRLQLPR